MRPCWNISEQKAWHSRTQERLSVAAAWRTIMVQLLAQWFLCFSAAMFSSSFSFKFEVTFKKIFSEMRAKFRKMMVINVLLIFSLFSLMLLYFAELG
jgi:hypothetical protein